MIPRARPSPLVVRALSGALFLALVVGLVVAGLPGIRLAAVVLGALALWEFRGLSALAGFAAPGWLLYPLGLFFAFSGTVLAAVPVQPVLAVALVAGLSALLFLPGARGGMGRWALGLAGALYIGLPFNYYLLIYQAAGAGRGLAWLLLVIVTVVVSDAAALLVGQRWGRRPFFPAISPKKTVEGAVAGLVFSFPVLLAGGPLLLGLGPWHAAALGALTGVFAQVGDLVESQLKRVAGVKDSSNLVPGHGGVLDRLDSMMFPPIVIYLYAAYLHLL